MEGGGGRLVEIGLTGERERMSSSRLAAAGLQSEGGREGGREDEVREQHNCQNVAENHGLYIVRRLSRLLCTLITPHWKLLQS